MEAVEPTGERSARTGPNAHVPDHVAENIESIGRMMAGEHDSVGPHQRAIETVTRGLTRPVTIYLLLTAVVGWIAYNTVAGPHGWPLLDRPPYQWLQGLVTFYAAATTTCVLIAQARQTRENARRAALEFHVNLLAEQKTTKIIALLEELRRDMPNVRDRSDPLAEALQEEVDPKAVHSRLEPERHGHGHGF